MVEIEKVDITKLLVHIYKHDNNTGYITWGDIKKALNNQHNKSDPCDIKRILVDLELVEVAPNRGGTPGLTIKWADNGFDLVKECISEEIKILRS